MENQGLQQMEQPVSQDANATQEQTTEQVEQKPEVFLDDDGNLVVSDEVLGLSEGGEQPEAEETSEQNEPQEEQRYYTKEEIEQLGIGKLDPNRIPPELVPFYKSMQADYTRKTQALAEERKVVEKLLDKALSHPELAKEFMNDPELVSLAQKHPELAQKFQVVSQMAQPEQQQNFLDVITEQAKRIVEAELGEEFDEFNPKHIAAFNLALQNIQNQIASQQAVQHKILQVKQSEPHFEEIDVYAQQKLAQMPFQEAMKIVNALQTGDLDTVLSFWDECRREWYNLNKAQPQAQPQAQARQAPQPPKVEPSGQGQAQAQNQFDLRRFATAPEEEKIEMLKQFL